MYRRVFLIPRGVSEWDVRGVGMGGGRESPSPQSPPVERPLRNTTSEKRAAPPIPLLRPFDSSLRVSGPAPGDGFPIGVGNDGLRGGGDEVGAVGLRCRFLAGPRNDEEGRDGVSRPASLAETPRRRREYGLCPLPSGRGRRTSSGRRARSRCLAG